MFGIGGTEWVVIGIVLLIAVGPTRLPKLVKTVVRTYRELRRATRELRASSGIDEILHDEDLRELRRPLQVPPPKKPAPQPKRRALTYTERTREDPPEGVDLAELRERLDEQSDEERERLLAAKEAQLAEEDRIRAEKIAAAGHDPAEADLAETDPEEHARRVAAKEAAAGLAEVDPEEHARRVAAKEAAARQPAASEPPATGADDAAPAERAESAAERTRRRIEEKLSEAEKR